MDAGAHAYRRLLNGDDGAMTEILRAYREGLTLFLNGYTKNFSDAEDLAQEVFVRLAVKKPSYRGDAAFRTWLYAIGRNLALDHLRRQKRAPIPAEDPANADRTDAEAIYLGKEKNETLWRVMGTLPDAYREILFLTYFEGLPNKAAARVLRKSTHSVETLVHRARRALRTALEKEGFDNESL